MQELKVDQKELEKRVKHVVSLSKEIPWYVRKYKELGIDPDEIRSPQDLLKAYEKGLYTTPQDLPELVYYEDKNTKEFYTSGTSGKKPKRVCMNRDDEKRIVNQAMKFFQKFYTKNDRILNCFPAPPAISGHMENCALSALGYAYKHAPAQELRGDPRKFMEYYNEFKPTSLASLTTFAYRLPKLLETIGIDSRKLEINTIMVSGEPSTIQRRKEIGKEFEARVCDFYGTSESGMVAYEVEPFTDEFIVTLPETLLFLVKNGGQVSTGEIGNVLLTNLYEVNSKPWTVLLNYQIGDWAKCIEKEKNEPITSISEIRREAAYLSGAKLHPQEVEKAIEELEEYKKELTGEYFIITYSDNQRRAIAEVRIESKRNIPLEDSKKIDEKVREKIYSTNFPVWNEVENVKNAKLLIEVTNPGELYKGYEQYIRPGKPKRLLVLTDV